MTEQLATPLSTVYAGWDRFQRDLLKAVVPLTPEQLALPLASNHWPIGRLVQHILADRIWWFHLWMGEGGPEITSHMNWDEDQPLLSPAELERGLEASWDMIAGALARWTVADLGQVFEPPAALTEEERRIFGPGTRQQIVWHVIRHDMHHGGELALGMGGHGLPTIWGN